MINNTKERLESIRSHMDNYIEIKYSDKDLDAPVRKESENLFFSSYNIKGTSKKIVCRLYVNSKGAREVSSYETEKTENIYIQPGNKK